MMMDELSNDGDQIAGDGIYTANDNFYQVHPIGSYRWEFQAVDQVDLYSNKITHYVEVVP